MWWPQAHMLTQGHLMPALLVTGVVIIHTGEFYSTLLGWQLQQCGTHCFPYINNGFFQTCLLYLRLTYTPNFSRVHSTENNHTAVPTSVGFSSHVWLLSIVSFSNVCNQSVLHVKSLTILVYFCSGIIISKHKHYPGWELVSMYSSSNS